MKKGWTLVESMIVVSVIGILMAIAIPSMAKIKKEQKEQKEKQEALAKNIKTTNTAQNLPKNLFPLEKEDPEQLAKNKIDLQTANKLSAERAARANYGVKKIFEVDGVSFYRSEDGSDQFHKKTVYFYISTNKNADVGITSVIEP